MARGFLAGVIWGTVVSAGTVAGLSLTMGRPGAPAPPPSEVVSDGPGGVRPEVTTTDPAPMAAPETAEGASGAIVPETTLVLPETPSEGLSAPETPSDPLPSDRVAVSPELSSDAPDAPAAPDLNGTAADAQAAAPASEALVPGLTPAPGEPLVAVSEGEDLAAAGDTQDPPRPQAGTEGPAGTELSAVTGAAAQTAPDGVPTVSPETTPETGAASAGDMSAVLGVEVLLEGLPQVQSESPADAMGQMADSARSAENGPDTTSEPATEAAADQASGQQSPENAGADTAQALPETASDDPAADEQAALSPRIGTPARSLIGRDSATSSRLPTVTARDAGGSASDGDTATDTGTGGPGGSTTGTGGPGGPTATRPLEAYAADVEVPAEGPRVSVVLIDDGTSPFRPEVSKNYPFPISVAIPTNHPDAASAAEAYRAAGHEVIAMIALPEGAQPQDVEVALAAALDTVPGAVAVMEDPEAGLGGNRAVSTQLAAFLKDSGHGLLTQPRGLNTAQQLAAQGGVPSLTLFRDVDGNGETENSIMRSLENAELRARQQDEGVVIVGRLRPNTISSLMIWAQAERGLGLTLAPVSAVLLNSAPAGQ